MYVCELSDCKVKGLYLFPFHDNYSSSSVLRDIVLVFILLYFSGQKLLISEMLNLILNHLCRVLCCVCVCLASYSLFLFMYLLIVYFFLPCFFIRIVVSFRFVAAGECFVCFCSSLFCFIELFC